MYALLVGQTDIGQLSRSVTTSIEHPWLAKSDADSVRVFLRSYDEYCRKVTERARQHIGKDMAITDVVTAVGLKYWMDGKWLESLIELQFIPNVDSYYDLDDVARQTYLDDKAAESKDVVTIGALDKLFKYQHRTDMTDKNARSGVETLFFSYNSLLRRHVMPQVVHNNEILAVNHVLSIIDPESLRSRLESDL